MLIFLEATYQQASVRWHDVVGMHPIAIIMPDYHRADLDRISANHDRYGEGDKPLWVTEQGLMVAE